MTSLSGTLRHIGAPLAVAIDSGGVHYETGGALVLRNVAGAVGASRVRTTRCANRLWNGAGRTCRIRQRGAGAGRTVFVGYRAARRSRPCATSLVGLQERPGSSSRGSPGRSTRRSAWTWMRSSRRRRCARRRAHLPGRLTIDGGTVTRAEPRPSVRRCRDRDAGHARHAVRIVPRICEAVAGARPFHRARHDRSARTRVGAKRGRSRARHPAAGPDQGRPRSRTMARACAMAVRYRRRGDRLRAAPARKST